MGEYEREREFLALEGTIGPTDRTGLSGMTMMEVELTAARDTLAKPAAIKPELQSGWTLPEERS